MESQHGTLTTDQVTVVLHCRHEKQKTVQLYSDCAHCEVEHLRYMLSPAERVDEVIPLLACPFDDGPAILYASRTKYRGEADEPELFECYVWCHECGARGPRTEDVAYSDADIRDVKIKASERWNNRKGP